MPFKQKEDYRKYMRAYMIQKRSEQQQLKQRILSDLQTSERLKADFPLAYHLLFGKKRKK